MRSKIDTSVLIVGAGPVGLTLAIDLASRGIRVTVVELRDRGEPPSVKCNHVSARSMEIYRRLGVSAKLRNAGLPADYPNDVSYRITTTGSELARIEIPCRRDRYTSKDGPDTAWPTPEPPHRINQIYIEPILFAHAEAMRGVTILNRASVDGFVQDSDQVRARIRNLDTGELFDINSEYLVGCDGGRSAVRKWIGARFQGTAEIQKVQSSYIRAPRLLSLMKEMPAWAMFSLNPRRTGNVYAIDGKERWLVHNYLKPDENDFGAVDRDSSLRTILGVDAEFEYELISNEDWVGRRLVADKLRDRRAFICGDAAHLWPPYAGYGMNAGIADAANLSWLLSARLKGWAPEGILGAHERERLPITEQVSHFAMDHAIAMIQQRGTVPQEIEERSARGERARAAIGRAAYDLNVQQYCCGGLNFGYFYDRSPIIAYDGASPPRYTMADFTTSTVPGCRTPHIWLHDGRSLYDAMGAGYALLRLDRSIDVAPLLAAAARRRVPMASIDIESDEASTYDRKLVLSRPDQHIAWRGNSLPADPDVLIDRLRGTCG